MMSCKIYGRNVHWTRPFSGLKWEIDIASEFWYSMKPTLSSSDELDTQPPVDEHRTVVVHVEKRDLVILLAQYKENLQGHI